MNEERKPLVTVFIPTYNRSNYLDDCLHSLLRQDFKNYEILIRDNDSDDDTFSVVEKYKPLFSEIAGYRYKKNSSNVGFRDNMVYGLQECLGKFTIILMDDDFFCSPKALSSLVKAISINQKTHLAVAPVCIYKEGEMDKTPKEIIDSTNDENSEIAFSTIDGEKYFLNAWTKYSPLVLSSTLFNTKTLLESPWSEWSKRAGVDTNMYHALSLNKCVSLLKKPLAYYRKHESNDYWYCPIEDVYDSHSHILKWYLFAKKNSDISRLSLLIWRIKSVLLKDRGTILILKKYRPDLVETFLTWLKKHNYFHYFLINNFSPAMMEIQEENGSSFFIKYRKRVLEWIVWLDKYVHDADFVKKIQRDKRQKKILKTYRKASRLQNKKYYKKAKALFLFISEESEKKEMISGSYYHVGEIYIKENNLDGAREMFNNCLSICPEHKKAKEYIQNCSV